MRILVDTNILFSALLFPGSKPAKALYYAAETHEIVLCDRNIRELRDILQKKPPLELSFACSSKQKVSDRISCTIHYPRLF